MSHNRILARLRFRENGFTKLQAAIYLVCVAVVIAAAVALFAAYLPQLSPAGGLSSTQAEFNKGDFPAALQQVDATINANPSDVQALIMKATILAQEGNLQFKQDVYGPQAAALAQQAIALDASSSEAYRILGYADEVQQKYAAAHAAYATAIALDPQNALAIFDDAHAWDLQGDIVQAEAGYQKALGIDPTLSAAQLGMGRVYWHEGKLAGALSYFQEVASSSSNVSEQAEATYSAGVIQGSLGDHAAALQYMREATMLDPSYPQGWAGLGSELFNEAMATSSSLSAQQRSATFAESISDLKKAITIYPDLSEAYYQLGVALAVTNQKQAAISDLQQTKKIIPNDITLSANDKTVMLAKVSSLLSILGQSMQ